MIAILGGTLTAFFGWTGGRGHEWAQKGGWPKWTWPLFDSWSRDWMISPICAALALVYIHPWSWHMLWALPLMVAATGGALSTYWDDLFGFDNFWFHGFVVGLASFPIAIITGHWWLFLGRAILLALWMGAWSAAISNADLEESGRYAPVGATLWLLC
jgi:hypothetical protein